MIHYYYGDGKGKTSAAIGACIRAAGNGLRCSVIQFLKNGASGETAVLKQLQIPVRTCSFQGIRFFRQMSEAEQQLVIAEHNRNLRALLAESADLIVLDEFGDALMKHAVDEALAEQVLSLNGCEIILTGHKPAAQIMEIADYITEFRAVAHPYRNGQPARKGIEF